MDSHIKELLWNQFGAAIDMLENAIIACPENLWNQQQFWYSAYHCLFFLDYYSTVPLTNFHPPKPFNLDELSPEGILLTEFTPKKKCWIISNMAAKNVLS
jgi:hypothetical protein